MFVLSTAILLWNKTKHGVARQAEACCYSVADLHMVLYQNCKQGSGGTCRILSGLQTVGKHLPLAQSPSRLKSLSVRITTTS
jgi:hypothetical protein